MFYSVQIRHASKMLICSETIWISFLIITNDFFVRAKTLSLGGPAGISQDIIVRQSVLDSFDSCLQGLVRHGWLSRQNLDVVIACVAPEPFIKSVDNSVVIVVSVHHGVIRLIYGCRVLILEIDCERGVASFVLHSSGEHVGPAIPAVVPDVDIDEVVFLQGPLSLDTIREKFERVVLVDKDLIPDATVSLDIKGSLRLVVGTATTEMEGSGGR